jgi:hypothetical protein
VIKNVGTGKMLSVNENNQLETVDASGTIWNINSVGNIKNSETKLSIDVPALSQEAGKALIVYASNSGDNQKWIFEEDDKGYVTITSKCSNLLMDASGDVVVQNSADDSDYQKWQLIETEEKDEYKVFVNGKEVEFNSKPYRPDSSSGVLCEVRPVLDALGVDYTYQTEGELPEKLKSFSLPCLTITSSGAVAVCGETAIHCGDESNLTNAEFYEENGELILEIAPLLGYVDSVTVVTDTEAKTVEITTK